jgi:hypothetical protein
MKSRSIKIVIIVGFALSSLQLQAAAGKNGFGLYAKESSQKATTESAGIYSRQTESSDNEDDIGLFGSLRVGGTENPGDGGGASKEGEIPGGSVGGWILFCAFGYLVIRKGRKSGVI